VESLLFAAGASLPLVLGGALGAVWTPPRTLLAGALAFATGTLIASLAFELVGQAYRAGDRLAVLLSFAAGAALFVVVDTALERLRTGGAAVGFALLAGVTLDGVPENTALGVTLVGGGSVALLVGVLASNFPEALTGSATMRDAGLSRRACVAVWTGATVLLAFAVLLGRYAFAGADEKALAVPLAFAGGAVLASLVDTLAPEAFRRGGPWIGLLTAAGFALGTHLAIG
jgi:ZIP family zinc transporter